MGVPLKFISLFLILATFGSFATAAGDNLYCRPGDVPHFGSHDGPAALPQSCFYTGLEATPSPGKVISVPNGSSVAQALENAACGDTIELQAGGAYEPFSLPGKNCKANEWITIRTSAINTLPPEGERISPCYAGVPSLPGRPTYACPSGGPAKLLASIILNSRGADGVIEAKNGATHYRLIGLEVTRGENLSAGAPLIQSAGGDHLIFDRLWVHGNALEETSNGIALHDAHHIAVIDSYFSDFHCTAKTGSCTDAKAIGGGNDRIPGITGTLKIVDNFLEGSGENILFGGGPSADVPADFEIRRNCLFKPMIWNPSDPTFFGTVFIVKNNFEIKNGRRVLFEGNILENSWGGFTQTGAHILLTPKNQANKRKGKSVCPQCEVEDITLRYNFASHGSSGLQIADGANGLHDFAMAGYNYSIHDMVFEALHYPTCYKCGKYTNQLGSAVKGTPPATFLLHDVALNHLTQATAATPAGCFTLAGQDASTGHEQYNMQITNSIFDCGGFGIWASGGGPTNCANKQPSPLQKFDACWKNYTFKGNILVGGTHARPHPDWPNGNFLPEDYAGIQMAHFKEGSGGDYHLLSSSPYHLKGTDGKDPGADIDLVNCYTHGVLEGSPSTSRCATPDSGH